MSKIGSLSTKQRRAVRSLLTRATVEAAAKDAGIGESTLYTWLRDDNFRAALVAAESDALNTASRRLVGLAEHAISTIALTMADPVIHPALRLRAADLLLGHMFRFAELRTIEERLQRLEEAVRSGQPN
jgi:transposase-like protein